MTSAPVSKSGYPLLSARVVREDALEGLLDAQAGAWGAGQGDVRELFLQRFDFRRRGADSRFGFGEVILGSFEFKRWVIDRLL